MEKHSIWTTKIIVNLWFCIFFFPYSCSMGWYFVAKNQLRHSKVHFILKKKKKISKNTSWIHYEWWFQNLLFGTVSTSDWVYILKCEKVGLKNVNKIAWKWNATAAKNNFYVHSDSYATDSECWFLTKWVLLWLFSHSIWQQAIYYALAQQICSKMAKIYIDEHELNNYILVMTESHTSQYIVINSRRNAMNLTFFTSSSSSSSKFIHILTDISVVVVVFCIFM